MQKTADVVIIGGGVIGASTLYHLAKHGVRNTLLIEMDTFGSGTTAFSAAWVMLQQTSELKIRMSQISLAEFYSLSEEYDIGFQQKGSLILNTEDAIAKETEWAAVLRTLGVKIDILTKEQSGALAPILNVSDIGIGRLCQEDGVVDAQALVRAYLDKARHLGARVEDHVKALDIFVENAQVVGVNTTQGFVSTPVVVNSAGIYAEQVASWVGIDLPIQRDLRHIVYTEPLPVVPDNMPLLEILSPELLFIGANGQDVDYTVGSFPTEEFEHKPRLDLLLEKYHDALLYRAPEVARAAVRNCTAGIRAGTPDNLPIVGPVMHIKGFINNCGWAGHGVMHSPFSGQLAAAYITGTEEPSISIDPFLLSRFDTEEPRSA